MNIEIRPATADHAPFIADIVLNAISIDTCKEIAGEDNVEALHEVFIRCAARPDSQYSWRNTLLAFDGETPVGGIVAYDGALLHQLRHAFVNETNELIGWNMVESEIDDETSDDEIYIDSLMVLPQYRGKGIASQLIRASIAHNAHIGKPMGLLVDYDNPRARRVYIASGFQSLGPRNFCGIPMEHMQHPVPGSEQPND